MLTVDTIKIWYLVHKWTSLICTTLLLLLCLTGLPLIFADELAVLLGDVVEPPEHVTATAPISLDALLKDALARRPHDYVKFLIGDEDRPVWYVSLGVTPTVQENSAVFMYDARTGAFLHELPVRQGLLYILFTLHVDLFAGLPGTLFLGVMGLVFLASVVSGVVLYGPFMRKLPFGVIRRDRSPRLIWSDLHNLLGIVTVIWVLVVSATGVINTLARPLLAYWQSTELAEMTTPWKGKASPTHLRSVDEALARAQVAVPSMTVSFVAFPGTLFASPHHYTVFMRGQTPLTAHLLKPVLVEAETAQVSESRGLPWYLTALLLSQPLHFGDYGGMPLKIIWALLDLITIVVLLSGLYLWRTKGRTSVEELLAAAEPDRDPSMTAAPGAPTR
jgi:uncharacterized iron-regulated membrane protein